MEELLKIKNAEAPVALVWWPRVNTRYFFTHLFDTLFWSNKKEFSWICYKMLYVTHMRKVDS